uniref:Uncharacterized protein n=1 Tax=Oryza brachyantha TaxID=4533 RepID=J3M2U0_ORYBR
ERQRTGHRVACWGQRASHISHCVWSECMYDKKKRVLPIVRCTRVLVIVGERLTRFELMSVARV